MEQFIVPQFIEKESKIIGPFTFKQFVFIGSAGLLCFILKSIVAEGIFAPIAVIILGAAFALAFLKINRTPLPVVIKNFFFFNLKPRMFLWKRKTISPKLIKSVEKPVKEEKESPLKVSKKSRIRNLSTFLETKS